MVAETRVTSVVFAGIGGQGVLKASDILAEAVFQAQLDIKKSEIHGMSQRGGSVTSDVRFGPEVHSPMVPVGEADFLVVLEETQFEPNQHLLKPDGVLLMPDLVDLKDLKNRKSLNTALLGVLSNYLDLDPELWPAAIEACFPPDLRPANYQAFDHGRSLGKLLSPRPVQA